MTRVPYTPPYLLGVMNLRGVIVPVIDLRTRFGVALRAADSSTVVIVVRVRTEHGEKTAGIVVDAVSEVYSFTPERHQADTRTGFVDRRRLRARPHQRRREDGHAARHRSAGWLLHLDAGRARSDALRPDA